jgi:(p)ppGpp synthase/HD superfamily hydrolase
MTSDIFDRVQKATKDNFVCNALARESDGSRLAFAYATAAHGALNQRRKYTGEPYINHPVEVANIVSCTVGVTESMIQAALLHDVVEDTAITLDEIGAHFGGVVRTHLSYLTDRSVQLNLKEAGVSRRIRKQIDAEHLSRASGDTQTIKLSDLISNSADIVKHDPKFGKVYLAEKEALLAVLTKGDKVLYEIATELLAEGKAALGIE